MTADSVVSALSAWQPGLRDLFRHAQPRIALALASVDMADAITAPGWVYDGARVPDVAHRWSREDERDRIYIQQTEGVSYTVLVGVDGARTLAVAVGLAEALEHARAYMAVDWRGGVLTPRATAPRAPAPGAPPPPRPLPPRQRVQSGTVADATEGYTLAANATLADEEATVLAIIRDARAYKERYDLGTARKSLVPTYMYLETILGRLSATDLQRLLRAYTRLPEENLRAAQGWYAMGASVQDALGGLLAKKRTTG